MAETYNLEVVLRAKQEGMAALKEAELSLGGIAKAGALVGVVLAGAVVAGAAAAVKATGEFQQAMQLIDTQAGRGQAEVKKMSAAVLEMAGSVGTAPLVLADALYHLESTGFTGAKALEALRVSAQGAKVGMANLTDVANALDAVLVAGVPEANNMSQAMGMLNAIVGAGDMKMQDLADAMGTGILASAKVFGLGLKDVGSALAVFGDNNIRGSDAATKLRMGITMMAAPSGPARDALKSIGIGALDLANRMRGPGGLVSALELLHDKLAKSGKTASEQGAILSEAFGGGKTATGIEVLLEQLERLKSKEADVAEGARKFPAAWEATSSNFNFKLDAMRAAVDAAGIKIGTVLLPYVARLLDKVTPLVPVIADWASTMATQLVPQIIVFANWLKTLGPDLQRAYDIIKTLAPYVAGVAAAWALWNVALAITRGLQAAILAVQFAAGIVQIVRTVGLWTAAQWLLNIALDANPIGIVLIAIAALAAGVIWAYQNVGWFKDAVDTLGGAFMAFAKQFWEDIGPIFDWIGNTLIPLIKEAVGWLGQLGATRSPSNSGQIAGGGRYGRAIGAASGFEGTVYKPTLFLAGEGGAPEHVSIGSGARPITIVNHFHIEGYYSDGPGLDRLSMAIAQRLSFVTGR